MGKKHFIEGDERLCEFFEGRYSLPCLFHRLLKKEYVRLNNTLYRIWYNSHPECQRIKMEIIKTLGIEDFELWKYPEQYIHLLRMKKKTTKHSLANNVFSCFLTKKLYTIIRKKTIYMQQNNKVFKKSKKLYKKKHVITFFFF